MIPQEENIIHIADANVSKYIGKEVERVSFRRKMNLRKFRIRSLQARGNPFAEIQK